MHQGHARKISPVRRQNRYELSDQKTPEKFAAAKVTVTGTLDPATKIIKVDKISAVK